MVPKSYCYYFKPKYKANFLKKLILQSLKMSKKGK